jgi:hypothetical protein
VSGADLRAARDELVALVGAHPGVALVDVGLGPGGEPALRVHVRRDGVVLPARIRGVPVVAVRGDYAPEGMP